MKSLVLVLSFIACVTSYAAEKTNSEKAIDAFNSDPEVQKSIEKMAAEQQSCVAQTVVAQEINSYWAMGGSGSTSLVILPYACDTYTTSIVAKVTIKQVLGTPKPQPPQTEVLILDMDSLARAKPL